MNTIRETNNAIFDDIFWVHLAYLTADDGIARLRALLGESATTRPSSPASRRSTGAAGSWRTSRRPRQARRRPTSSIWEGNVQLLEHEQRALVQPHFDRLSCAFARLISIGSATSFEVRGLRQEVAYFTSFYLYSLSRGIPRSVRAQAPGRGSPGTTTAGPGS